MHKKHMHSTSNTKTNTCTEGELFNISCSPVVVEVQCSLLVAPVSVA